MVSRSSVWRTGSVAMQRSASYSALTGMPSTVQEAGAAVLYRARLPQPCTVTVQAAVPLPDGSQRKLCTAAPLFSMLTSPAHAF